jgi:diguanylate cyclase (GGDEF)-like protein
MIILFIILFINVSQFALGRLQKHIKDDVHAVLHTILRSNHGALNVWIDQRKLDVATLAKKRKIVNLTSKLINQRKSNIKAIYDGTLSEIKRYLSPELEKNNDMEFYIISNNGMTVASNNNNYVGKLNFIYEFGKDLLNNVLRGRTEFINVYSKEHGESVNGYYIVSPMQDVLGVVVAMLVIRIDPAEEFTRITHLGRLGDSGETYAFNLDGFLITQSRFSNEFKKLGLVNTYKDNEALIKITDPGFDLYTTKDKKTTGENRPLTVMAQSAVQGESGFNVDGYRDYRGVLVMGAWLWDRDLGFGLATEIDFAEGMQNYHEVKNILIVMLLIVIVLAITLFILIQILQKESKIKLSRAYEQLERRVFDRTKELEDTKSKLTKLNKELELLSITDGLTGISNRRNFDNHLDNEWRHCMRESMSVTIIMFDIDHFKKYNDTYGHQKGDECIKSIANMLKNTNIANRPGDIVARYGGEEFVVVLINATIEHSGFIANMILEGVRELRIPHESTSLGDKFVTVSVGYAREERLHAFQQNNLILKADKALYKAKADGRNQACVYSNFMEEQKLCVI